MNLTIQIPDEFIDFIAKRIAEEMGYPNSKPAPTVKAKPEELPEPAPTVEAEPVEDPTYTRKDLTSALTAVGKTQGRDGIIAVLKSAGFTSPKDVGESDYAKVIGLAQEALH